MSLAGLILAAGASSRMGRPKALLKLGGTTFLERLLDTLGASCSPLVVVLGYDAEAIREGTRRAARFVVNPDPARGQLSSMQCGLAVLPEQVEGFMFTPVDYPAIEPATVERLAAGFRSAGCLVAVPRHDGRRGHPVCCAGALIPEFLALPPEEQARTVIHRHSGETAYVDVDDPGILLDVDDPAAYETLVRALPR